MKIKCQSKISGLFPCRYAAKFEHEGKTYCGYHHPGKLAERQIAKLKERIESLTAIVEKGKV